MAAKKWIDEQRKQQSIRNNKQLEPWQHSTDAKSLEGKAITSQNGGKGVMRKLLKDLSKYLKQQGKR